MGVFRYRCRTSNRRSDQEYNLFGWVYFFNVPDDFKEGNAVIAAKNADGIILWSWHIWLTDIPKEHVYYNDAGIMMDRNLGATSATPGEAESLGLLYQWGRKDPFLGSSYIHDKKKTKSTITWPPHVESSSSTGTVEYAVANPTTLITEAPGRTGDPGSSDGDWHYQVRDNTLWSPEKSIYDPCPVGWKVPDGGRKGVWIRALGSDSAYASYDNFNKGINFTKKFGDDTIWYPAAGYQGDGDAGYLLYNVGFYGNYWSCSPNGFSCTVFELNFSADGTIRPMNARVRSDGLSVRCLKEHSQE